MVSLQIVEKKKSMVHSCACLLLVFFHDFFMFLNFLMSILSLIVLQQVVCREILFDLRMLTLDSLAPPCDPINIDNDVDFLFFDVCSSYRGEVEFS
jgi:hypothetical protein